MLTLSFSQKRPKAIVMKRAYLMSRIVRSLGIVTLCLGLCVALTPAHAQAFTGKTVNAADNIFGAGQASPPGGGNLPTGYTLDPGAGRTLTFSSVTGSATFNASNFNDPDGIGSVSNSSTNAASGLSGITNLNHAGYLAGVFLPATGATGPTPSTLVFSDTGTSGSIATSFTSLSPALDQTFFIGDGMTGDGIGSVQQFVVPAEATRLYLGFADAPGYHGDPGAYGDNFGNFTASFTVSGGVTATPEPSSYALLLASAFSGLTVVNRRRRKA